MIQFGSEENEKCARDIIEFLLKHGLFTDVAVYVNGKRYKSRDYKNTWDSVVVEEGCEARNYFEFVGDFLSMSFEGGLYDVLNYYFDVRFCDEVREEFDGILRRYDKYYELGDAWNLSLYNI